MKKYLFFGTSGIIIAIFDWFVYSGWVWVLEHNTCIISGVSGICWGVSPFPAYVITIIAIILTLSWFIYFYDSVLGCRKDCPLEDANV